MNVNDFEKHISGYLDGELRDSDAKKFEELLNSNLDCRKKLEDYKKMLDMLSSIEVKASNDFLDKVYDKIEKDELKDSTKIDETVSGYNYMMLSGIAATIGIFVFSLSIFINSDSSSFFGIQGLTSKNIEKKSNDLSEKSIELFAEKDTSIIDNSPEDNEINLPKIHLVGGKK